MNEFDNFIDDGKASLTLAGLGNILEQKPSVTRLAEVDAWLRDKAADSPLWLNFSAKEAEIVEGWVAQNLIHVLGVPLMIAIAVIAGLSAGFFTLHNLSEGHVVAGLWTGTFGSGIKAALIAAGVALVTGLVVFNVLFTPMASLWNQIFGCGYATNIMYAMMPIDDEEDLDALAEEASECPAALAYLDAVSASRGALYQDFKVVKALARAQPKEL